VIAFDTNVLVYAHRKDSAFHHRARECVRRAAEGSATWAIPWPCVHEFLAIVTSAKVFKTPTPVAEAVTQVEAWLRSPTLRLLSEEEGYFDVLAKIISDGRISGPKIHDARIAALALLHGVSELLTADRDFSRFPAVTTRNPL
jgi:toxin-antitoxin system PIN domain toxin